MKQGQSAIEHYKSQRDILFYYLTEVMGVSRKEIAKLLGVHQEAVSQQFTKRRTK